jgi:uncharacterized cofD-like protein
MRGIKIVTIGGGTGSFTLLKGLKKYPVDISAIVSMADDGGSTGVLRDELGVLPPGDVRQCLVALSDSSDVLRRLMNYRFAAGKLKGHNFGNLLLSGMEKITGSFSKGVEEVSRILNVKGEVIPVTKDDVSLCMELNGGKILAGQLEIWKSDIIEKSGIKNFNLKPDARANPKAISCLKESDVIIIGPGSHYGSVLPNLLVRGISRAIVKSKAIVIYNCNLVNKKGQTEKMRLDDYVCSVNNYLGGERINFAIYNTKKPDKNLVAKYERQKEILVGFLPESVLDRKYKVILADLLSSKVSVFSPHDAISSRRSLIRHDSDKLARVIMEIADGGRRKSSIKKII